MIDYLQLLHSTARRAENRQQEIADISNGIKSLAKVLSVPVIVLSQPNRELELVGFAGSPARLNKIRMLLVCYKSQAATMTKMALRGPSKMLLQ